MPNIVEYNAPTQLAPQPSDRASSAHAVAARRIDIAYNQAGAAYQHLGHEVGTTISELGHQYVDYQFHREVSAGGLAATHILAGLQDSWNTSLRSPGAENDSGLQKRFLEGQVEPALEKFRESFHTLKGQEWADNHANRMREHFFTTTTADMSTNAGIAAHNNFIRAANTLTGMVDKDPSTIDVAAASLKDHIDALIASSPNMKGTAAVKFREDATQHGMEAIVRAGVQSDIRRGGDGSAIANHPVYSQYVNVGERKAFEQQQRQMERFARADQRYQRMVEKQEQQEKGQDGINRILTGLRGDHPEEWSMPAIIRMKENGELPGPWFEHAVRIFDRETKEDTPARISQDNARVLFNRMRLPPDDPNRINDLGQVYAAYGNDDPDKQISKADLNFLTQSFVEMRTPEGGRLTQEVREFVQAHKAALDKSVLGQFTDELGGIRMYKFERALMKKMDQYRAEGKNPRDLLDPDSKDYFGTPQNISRFLNPLDTAARGIFGPPQAKPGLEAIFGGK